MTTRYPDLRALHPMQILWHKSYNPFLFFFFLPQTYNKPHHFPSASCISLTGEWGMLFKVTELMHLLGFLEGCVTAQLLYSTPARSCQMWLRFN